MSVVATFNALIRWIVDIVDKYGRATLLWIGEIVQRTLTLWGNITVRLTSCLTGLDLTKQVKVLFIQHKQKQLNPNKINERSAIQCYFPLS